MRDFCQRQQHLFTIVTFVVATKYDRFSIALGIGALTRIITTHYRLHRQHLIIGTLMFAGLTSDVVIPNETTLHTIEKNVGLDILEFCWQLLFCYRIAVATEMFPGDVMEVMFIPVLKLPFSWSTLVVNFSGTNFTRSAREYDTFTPIVL
jgi:hypothetical protein